MAGFDIRCNFSFLLVFSFLAVDWVKINQIENFKRLNISPGREEFKTHLDFIIGPRKG